MIFKPEATNFRRVSETKSKLPVSLTPTDKGGPRCSIEITRDPCIGCPRTNTIQDPIEEEVARNAPARKETEPGVKDFPLGFVVSHSTRCRPAPAAQRASSYAHLRAVPYHWVFRVSRKEKSSRGPGSRASSYLPPVMPFIPVTILQSPHSYVPETSPRRLLSITFRSRYPFTYPSPSSTAFLDVFSFLFALPSPLKRKLTGSVCAESSDLPQSRGAK